MRLSCTKKLLEYLDIKPKKETTETDPFFAWTANLLVVNRRKTLVVAHEPSRCAFVIHGLTTKLRSKLPQLILEGIRAVLESEYVRPDIMERYLAELGAEVSFGANTSRKAVACCNKVCERIKMFPEVLDPDKVIQRKMLPWLNGELIAGTSPKLSCEILIDQLRERYGDSVQSCRALELQVSLDLHIPCKRRIVVPDDLNFYQFHHVLQECFAWKDCHLHQFVIEADDKGYPTKIIHPDVGEDVPPQLQVQESRDVTLGEVFASRERIIYEYDLGDCWLHLIELCRVIENCEEVYPYCMMAVGIPPMEDSGGPDGFAHIMEVLNDKSHPEHQEFSEWVHSIWWAPPDMNRLNRWLLDAHRRERLRWWY